MTTYKPSNIDEFFSVVEKELAYSESLKTRWSLGESLDGYSLTSGDTWDRTYIRRSLPYDRPN